MQLPNKIAEYLEAVGKQMRWKRAQASVLEEIKNHITDQKNAYIRDGHNEETAIDRAIAEMGDPIVVGVQLDRTHRPRPDWPLLVMTAILLFLGITILFFVGPNILDGTKMFEKQVIWAGIAILVMFAAYFVDFTIIGKYPKVIFFVLCAITIVCYLYTESVNGWSIYVSIYMIYLLFPTAFAGFVYSMRNKRYGGLILCGAVFIVPAVLSMIVSDVTVLFLICTSCLIILSVAVTKGWFIVSKLYAMLILYIPTAIVLLIPLYLMMGEGYAGKKYPSLDQTGAGHIGTVIQQFLSHSQFIGEGLPISGYREYAASQLLPAANTDFLLTYLIYRLGWIVFIGIIAIFLAFIIRAVIICKKQKSILGFLVSLAIILTFALQCIIYIASNLGFLLFSPVSLPLISYGGRALITNMFLIGFLLSVFRTGNLVRDKAGVAAANSSRLIQYDNGQIIINLKTNSIK